MAFIRRSLRWLLLLGLAGALLGALALGVLYWLIAPKLPDVQALRTVELQVPLRVVTSDGKLIALFGETRRIPVAIEDVPDRVKQAFLAGEDADFYTHPGIDIRGILRAVWLLATTEGKRVPGGSTITQQVARQFFLSPEVSYTRKLTEIFLALKMEREFSKDEILELYLNKSFFGNRAYGIAAAAEYYYGKTLDQLTLPEAAMLASIPKFPSSGNPIVNPDRALLRRGYILQRMHEEGFIDADTLARAMAEPDTAAPHEPPIEVEAPYVAEMARQEAMERLGPDAMTGGYQVITTLDGSAQEAANRALRNALVDYDRRHGWRGAEAHADLPAFVDAEVLRSRLSGVPAIAGMQPAIVTDAFAESASLTLADGQSVVLTPEAVAWARPLIDENRRGPAPKRVDEVVKRGDRVRVALDAEGRWGLAQIPKVQGALVALDPENGAVRALSGGFSFSLTKFNRVTQALRQPGSSFKPFVYAAAFERGFTPASIVLDAPVVFNDRGSGQVWRPQNDNQTFAGPMRLREAMVTSRNLVSVRVLDAVGVAFAQRFLQAFGFPAESLPPNLSLALGTTSLPPLAVARGYAVFANQGYLIDPFVTDRILDRNGQEIHRHVAARACADCAQRRTAGAADSAADGFDLGRASAAPAATQAPDEAEKLAPQTLDPRNAYLVSSLLRDVVRRGTGRGALALGRSDVGGKTGTTNDYRDAWFSGFAGPLVATAWVGMDDFSSLGRGEFASKAALPMWVEFMRVALDGEPEVQRPMPSGITTALIDPESGHLVPPGTPGAIAELLKVEDLKRLEQQMTTTPPGERRDEVFDIF